MSFIEFIFILNKNRRDKNGIRFIYFIFRSGGGIVVIIIVSPSYPKKKVVLTQFFVPSKLPKPDALVGQIFHIAINRILVVIGIAEIEKHFVRNKQWICAHEYRQT